MKQTYDFEAYTPPVLTENMLRQKLEQRRQRRQTVLLLLAGILFQLVILLAGMLVAETYPRIFMLCICYAVISSASCAVIAIVYTQTERRGGL